MSTADDKNNYFALSVGEKQQLFSQLEPQHVEAFYQHYQYWQRQRRIVTLQEQLAVVEQHILDNSVLLQRTQPSPIALATLTRLQSCGVEDIDLLDTMLERGDTWLDHTLQQLEQCERLDFIHDNYTQWCRNALEGAYNWLDSMSDAEVLQEKHLQQSTSTESVPTSLADTTEVLLLQKLMSEENAAQEQQQELSVLSVAIEPIVADETQQSVDAPGQQTLPLPALLSYAMPTEILEPENRPAIARQRSPRIGLVSRLMAKVWQT